jgi:hypothetical protein
MESSKLLQDMISAHVLLIADYRMSRGLYSIATLDVDSCAASWLFARENKFNVSHSSLVLLTLTLLCIICTCSHEREVFNRPRLPTTPRSTVM